MSRRSWIGVGLFLAGVVVVVATADRGAFIIDENNHIAAVAAARQGGVVVPHTQGLPASCEAAWFDPVRYRFAEPVEGRPVAATVPPLYGFLAAPFASLGLRGLIALNALALMAAAWLLFALIRRHGGDDGVATLGALAFLGGASLLEYARGVWPHVTSLALVLGAFVAVGRAREAASVRWAVLGGLLAGVACGVRYQNAVSALALVAGLVILTPASTRRWPGLRLALAFGVGALGPLLLSAALNAARGAGWNPLSKGDGYLKVAAALDGGGIAEAVRTLLAKVVWFDLHPVDPTAFDYLWRQATGAPVVGITVKKAWLQSSPWLVAALLSLASAWRAPRRDARQRDLAAAGLVVAATLGLFAVAGFGRTDGYGYNQRYFLDLVPFVALALALACERSWWRPSLTGLAAALAFATFLSLPHYADAPDGRVLWLSRGPLVLALVLAIAWAVRRRGLVGSAAASVALGLGLGWALGAHVFDDLAASHRRRTLNGQRLAAAAAVVPERSAIFVDGVVSDALGPLILDHDVVLANPCYRSEPGPQVAAPLVVLRDRWLSEGRRIFVADVLPEPIRASLAEGMKVVPMPWRSGLSELVPAAASVGEPIRQDLALPVEPGLR